jgi:hypothetical protein
MFSVSRSRLIALLLVAVFSFASAATATALASDATISKKSKKCKKGYKKSKGKCKKKSSAKKKAVTTQVSSVTLRITDTSIYVYEFEGEVVTKTPLTSIPVTVTAAKGNVEIKKDVVASGDGSTTTLKFSGKVTNPIVSPKNGPANKGKPITLVAVSDGVSSPTVKP